MTVLELFTLLSRVSFLGLAFVTGLSYLENRDPVRRDIFLTFMCLTASIWLQVFTSLTGLEIPGQLLIGRVLIVAQPYLMIRLIRYFRPVPLLVYTASIVGMLASWAILIFIGLDQGPLATEVIIAYFALIDGYAVIAFIRGAYNSIGVVRQRLRFAAIGSLLLITALVLAGINAVLPQAGEFVRSLTQLCAISCAVSYFLGFAPPRWLRRTWQDAELHKYLQQMEQAKEQSLEGVVDRLETAIKRGIGTNTAAVRIAVSDLKTGTLINVSPAKLSESTDMSSLEGVLDQAWRKQSPQVIQRPRQSAVGDTWEGMADADTTLVIPLITPARPLGLLVVEMQYRSLFPDEDVALLKLFGQQAAVVLQNQRMIDELSARSEDLEQMVKARTADLERSNRELKSFAYVASHDLQEPLRTISSYLQLIDNRYNDKLDSEGHEFIAFAVDGAIRMKALIQDVLAYSRVETQPKQFTTFNLQGVVDEVCQLLERAINEAQAIITYDDLPVITADRRLISQVFQNLLSNAIKYRGDRKPEIYVSHTQENGYWHFSVKDNGIGIEPQYMEQIFVVFRRLHDRETYSGTGVGLAICKKAVDLHGGRIWAESEPGTGSTFHFTLPIQPIAN
jgi:signal transduction histidine kinase